MKDDQHFRKLLYRHINNEITDEEKAELNEMLKSKLYDFTLIEEINHDLVEDFNSGKSDDTHTPVLDEVYLDLKQIISRSKSGKMPLLSLFQRYGTVAAVLSLILGLLTYYFLWKTEPIQPLSKPQLSEEWVHLYKKDLYTLPDGSSVNLNENSQLSYLKSFSGAIREVKLSGEAYFDVTHDAKRPFIIHTGDIHTRVLGTAFTITTSDKEIKVSVIRGKVEVGNKSQIFDQVKAEEAITVNTDNYDFKKIPLGVLKKETSKDNKLNFEGTSLEDVAKLLESRFNVKIIIENDAIKKCRINALFGNNEDMHNILELVFGTRQATYLADGNQITIKGGIGCETN